MKCSYCPEEATHFGEGEPVCEAHIFGPAADEYELLRLGSCNLLDEK